MATQQAGSASRIPSRPTALQSTPSAHCSPAQVLHPQQLAHLSHTAGNALRWRLSMLSAPVREHHILWQSMLRVCIGLHSLL